MRTDFPDADLVESLLVFNIRHNRYMEHRGLRRADLLPIFGSRSVASDVLAGKREPSKAHIRKLAEFFHVSADLFL